MADPLVRDLGSIEDYDGVALFVGVDYGTVTIGHAGGDRFRLNMARCEEFVKLFVHAVWEAGLDFDEANDA